MAVPATLKEILIPAQADDYGLFERFFHKYFLLAPPNTDTIKGPRFDSDGPGFYFNRGLTAIQFPSGVPAASSLATPAQIAVLSGRAFFNDPNSNKLWSSYTNADTDRVVNYWLTLSGTTGGAKFSSFDTKEDYTGHGMWEDANPGQYARFWKSMGMALEARGQYCLGDYDGPFLFNNTINTGDLWTALNGPAEALHYVKDIRNAPYFRLELYNYGNHAIVQPYFRGAWNYHDRMYEHAATLGIAKMAMDQSGATAAGKKLCAYTENIVNEFTGYNTFNVTDLKSGGYVEYYGNTPIHFDMMLMMYVMNAQDCDILFEFTDPGMSGVTENVIEPDVINQDGVRMFHSNLAGNDGTVKGQAPQRLWYDQPKPSLTQIYGGPMPTDARGFGDTFPLGTNIAGALCSIVGTKDWEYPSIKAVGSGIDTFVPGPGHSFCKVMHDNNLPWCRAAFNPETGKGWFMYLFLPNYDAQIAVGPHTFILTVQGISQEFTMLPGAAQFWEFTV